MRLLTTLIMAFALLLPVTARAAEPNLGSDDERANGEQLYSKYCSQCHGDNGDGEGIAAPFVEPKPRDFTAGKYKIRTTPGGSLPSDEDLVKVIREGMPYTSMPAWPQLTDDEIMDLVYFLKTFSANFADPEYLDNPIDVPEPQPWSEQSAAKGMEVYDDIGCGGCHGMVGRGDGPSASTLEDDAGNPLRAADLTKRWTFRGGPTREDIFIRFTTGLNGTPMPTFAESLDEEERWQLVDYIYSIGRSDEPNYSNLILAHGVEAEIDVASEEDQFAEAGMAHVALIGQIIEPGRRFVPSTDGIEVRAIFNQSHIAFELVWHDMSAETSGSNAPNLEVARFEPPSTDVEPEGGDDDFWGEEESDDDDVWGDEEVADDDVWGEEEEDDGYWDDEEGSGDGDSSAAGSGFSDAVAIQLPTAAPAGIRKPYFLFGDSQNSADLWFVDLATSAAQRWVGKGSSNVVEASGEDLELSTTYEDGRWRVVLKRARFPRSEIGFDEGRFLPIAFSVWDGFKQDHGNQRALSRWVNLYLEPIEKTSPLVPAAKTGFLTFALLIVTVGVVRFRARSEDGTAEA